jgi:hypothetical protein
MRWWIAATALLALPLMAGHHTRAAADAAVIYLSCAGTVEHMTGKSEPIANLGLVINLAEHTVTGLSYGYVAHIDSADDVSISFSGAGGSALLFGDMARVTGAMSALNKVWVGDKVRIEDSYDLVCKITNRLFSRPRRLWHWRRSRRASSRVRKVRRRAASGFLLEVHVGHVGERLPVGVADDEAGVRLLGGPGQREAASAMLGRQRPTWPSTAIDFAHSHVVQPHHSLSLRLRLPLTRKFLRLPDLSGTH